MTGSSYVVAGYYRSTREAVVSRIAASSAAEATLSVLAGFVRDDGLPLTDYLYLATLDDRGRPELVASIDGLPQSSRVRVPSARAPSWLVIGFLQSTGAPELTYADGASAADATARALPDKAPDFQFVSTFDRLAEPVLRIENLPWGDPAQGLLARA